MKTTVSVLFLFSNPLSAKLTKRQNTLKQFVGNLSTNCLSVFGHFVRLALKGLISINIRSEIGGDANVTTQLVGYRNIIRLITW